MMQMPQIWVFHLILIGAAVTRQDGMMMRISGVLLLNWAIGRWFFLRTGEQFNPLVNAGIDMLSFWLVMFEAAMYAVGLSLEGSDGQRLRAHPSQLYVGALYFFLLLTHAAACWMEGHGRLVWPATNVYWYAQHDATWLQMWGIAFWILGGGHVVGVMGSIAGDLWHRGRRAVGAPSRPDLQLVEGGLDGRGWEADRGLSVGWPTGPDNFGADRDHLIAAAAECGIGETGYQPLLVERIRPLVDRGLADIIGGQSGPERRHVAGSRDAGRAPGSGSHADDPGTQTGMKDKVSGLRAVLLAAFRVPSSEERRSAVDKVAQLAKKVEEAGKAVEAICCYTCGEDTGEAVGHIAAEF